MKIIIYTYTVILLIASSFLSCKDSEYGDLYPDPSKTSKISPEKLMTGVFYSSLQYTKPTYYGYYTMDILTLSRYTQTIGVISGDEMYRPNDGYVTQRWKSFYNSLTQFRLLESVYDKLDEQGKVDNEIFVLVSKVFLYGQLQEIIDLWGDVPFSEAGRLPITSDIKSSYASYENAGDLYKMMLDDLKAINIRLSEMDGTLSSLASIYFTAQDYINNGNVLKWRKYANSLRLRMALRAATQGDLMAEGRSVLKEMLENEATYPVIADNSETIQINADREGFDPLRDEDGSRGIMQAFETNQATGVLNRAPKPMLDRMLPDDPRVPVMFSPNSKGDYIGLDLTERSDAQRPGLEQVPNLYASIDSATINRNDRLPGILFTAAEVSFIKAEAYNEGYAKSQADAKAAFEQAVTQSVNFYYDLNALSSYAPPVSRPDVATVAAFVASRWTGDANTAIATQKWLHFFCIHTQEAWSELRRTKLPQLDYLTDNTSVETRTPVDRFLYPLDERTFNSANYRQVQEQDTYYTKIFWAKP
jgi:hypothetical protein